jgi:site-specific DNA-methyltransferase (adenine-specific)
MLQINKIHNVDVLEGLRSLEENSIDLIITSPPYNLSIGYTDNSDRLDYDDYLAWATAWLGGCRRVLKPDGRICINVPLETNLTGKRFIESDYISILEILEYTRMANITWDKRNLTSRTAWGSWLSPVFPVVNNPLECILVYAKESKRHLGNKEDIDITRQEFIDYTLGIWNMAPAKKSKVGHPAPFPEELPYRCMKLFSYRNDLVLDTFIGSGTTAVVAKKLGRRYIGFDISKEYCGLAEANLDSIAEISV